MATAVATRHSSRNSTLDLFQRHALKRALAIGVATQQELGDQFGLSRSGVAQFARRHAAEIQDIRENMDDPFAGILLARKENRLLAYVDEVRRLDEHPNADHHLWSAARQQAIHHIAEELGQLPPRMTVTVQPVTHVIEGVSVDDLR